MLRVEKPTSRLFVCKSPQCLIATAIKFNQNANILFRPRVSSRNNNFILAISHFRGISTKIFVFCFHRNFTPSVAIQPKNIPLASNLVYRDAPRCRLSAREICVALFRLLFGLLLLSDRSAAVFAASASESRHANASPFSPFRKALWLSKTKHSKGALDIIRCLLLMMWNVSVIVVKFKWTRAWLLILSTLFAYLLARSCLIPCQSAERLWEVAPRGDFIGRSSFNMFDLKHKRTCRKRKVGRRSRELLV